MSEVALEESEVSIKKQRKEAKAAKYSAKIAAQASAASQASLGSSSAHVKFCHLGDRNFDGLTEKFAANIYGTRKGRLRLDIVIDDLEATIGVSFPPRIDPSKAEGNSVFHSLRTEDALQSHRKLVVLDAGGGLGQLSAQLAAQVCKKCESFTSSTGILSASHEMYVAA